MKSCPRCAAPLASVTVGLGTGGGHSFERAYSSCEKCYWIDVPRDFQGHATVAMQKLFDVWRKNGELEKCFYAGAVICAIWEQLREIPPGAQRARAINSMIDDAVAKHLGEEKVSCRRGCFHCCYMFVAVTRDEALLLRASGVSFDSALIERQAVNEQRFTELLYRHRRCPFLSEQGECRVYENRPYVCRKYLVASDPALCDTRKKGADMVGLIALHEAEFITSAALNLDEHQEFKNIATMLKATEHEGVVR